MVRMDEATRKRMRAGRLKLAGTTPAEAAKAVGAARQTAYTWKARLDEGDIDALSAMAAGRLLGAMGCSLQKPERRAIERNEQAVLAWKRKTWPARTATAH